VINQHVQSHVLLEGVVVVSLAINLPGPLTAARLSKLGARITTVLPPSGDPIQQYQPEWFADLHAGQDLVTLDLKSPDGIRELDALLAQADILITSSRPSSLARLGLDPETVSRKHPRLCQIAIFGESGINAENSGHDLTYQAINGLVSPPTMPITLIADMAGAERATQIAMAALFHRERTGAATHHEVALADVAYDMAEPNRRGLTKPGGGLGGGVGLYGIYETQDGWIALAAIESHFAQRIMNELKVDASVEAFAQVFTTKTATQWEHWAKEKDIPLVAIP
jgi:crotonobetainyl-CoA:carnitine CoA-transferase CaiB-like acyl-CoA transferase